jgi:hypothetical protein
MVLLNYIKFNIFACDIFTSNTALSGIVNVSNKRCSAPVV